MQKRIHIPITSKVKSFVNQNRPWTQRPRDPPEAPKMIYTKTNYNASGIAPNKTQSYQKLFDKTQSSPFAIFSVLDAIIHAEEKAMFHSRT